jgi:mRNA interferase RelE/StbE
VSDAAWRVELTRAAERDLRRLDQQVRRRVIAALDGLSAQPPHGDISRLAGIEREWRLRVGDWRVRFTRDQTTHTVYALRVLPRGRAYRD